MGIWLLLSCTAPETDAATPSTLADTAPPLETGESEDRVWVQMDAQPCARDAMGYVECWSGNDGLNFTYQVPPSPEPFVDFTITRGGAQVAGLTPEGEPNQWHCGGVDSPQDCQYPPPGPFIDMSIGSGMRADGSVEFWDEEIFLSPPGIQTLFAPYGPGSVMLSTTNIARTWTAIGLRYEVQLDPETHYVEIAHLWESICLLDAAGNVTCHGPPAPDLEPPVFLNPPYIDIAGGNALCAKRPDHVLECHNGETFDFGPIRDFAVDNRGEFVDHDNIHFTPPQHIRPTLDGPFEICVITEANAIQCQGVRYTPDLLESLPN